MSASIKICFSRSRRLKPYRTESSCKTYETVRKARGFLRVTGTNCSLMSRRKSSTWWRIKWFWGMRNDIKRRAPFYTSDWVDAWDYRVIPATVYMYVTKYVPRWKYSLDLFFKVSRIDPCGRIRSIVPNFESTTHDFPVSYQPSHSLLTCSQRLT